jgi:hypothetical protein
LRNQGSAGGLLGHAPGLKDQPLAACKLDGYFMLCRHRVLFRFQSETCLFSFVLGKFVWEERQNSIPEMEGTKNGWGGMRETLSASLSLQNTREMRQGPGLFGKPGP